jgi:hypothetical protein
MGWHFWGVSLRQIRGFDWWFNCPCSQHAHRLGGHKVGMELMEQLLAVLGRLKKHLAGVVRGYDPYRTLLL